jgi:hypothetical protein
VDRPEVIEKLKSTTLLGRVIVPQGLLRLIIKMSLSMQTCNVVPWELMQEEPEFYGNLVLVEAALRD